MANKEKQAENKEKIGIGAWLALIVLILVLSGAFRTAEGPIKVLDFTNLAGSFGQIGDTGANLIGKGGTGAKDGFMAGFNLIPAVMFFCGLLGVFEQLGACLLYTSGSIGIVVGNGMPVKSIIVCLPVRE